jgi:hypothetical protein
LIWSIQRKLWFHGNLEKKPSEIEMIGGITVLE